MSARQVEQTMARAWELLPAEGPVLLAVSGGADSMVLLEAARLVAAEKLATSRLLVAHVNHGLRGAESDGDEALVRAECARHGLPFRAARLTWEEGKPSQAACRARREAFFASLLDQPSARILYAHHADDQAETVLFRLMRGSGIRGLRGILPVNGKKLRPFLGLPKQALLDAAAEWELDWREDSSNASASYDRNWLRLGVLPLLEARRPGVKQKLAALALEAQELELPAPSISQFSVGEGVSFAKGLAGAGSAELSSAFFLGRRHALGLESLLKKSSGRAEAEGVRFTWSAGVLLAERGAVFSPGATTVKTKFTSCLGHWELPEGLRPAARRGASVKKEFQRHRVPVFFRPALPLVEVCGKARLLLPGSAGAACKPSALARWWLEL